MRFMAFALSLSEPGATDAVRKWLETSEDGGTRIPKLVNTEIVNTPAEPAHGLPMLVQKQILVMTVFYDIEYVPEPVG